MATVWMTKTPGQMFAFVFGIVYIAIGLLGFVFLGGERQIFGIFGIDFLHNVAHLAIGALLLFTSSDSWRARIANLIVGGVYLLLAVLGFAGILEPGKILNVNDADNILHIATAGIALYFGTLGSGMRTTAVR